MEGASRRRLAPLALAMVMAIVIAATQASLAGASPGAACDGSPLPGPRVELCGTTVLSGSEGGVTPVHLSEEVTIQNRGFGPDKGVDIAGDGAFIGFAIASDDVERDVGLVAGIVPREPFSQTDFLFFLTWGGIGTPDEVTLPVGDYRLYLLADGSPITVVLDLDPMVGQVQISSDSPNHYDARALDPRIDAGPTHALYVAGENGTVGTLGVGFQMAWLETGQAHAFSQLGVCSYRGGQSADQAYGPGCGTPEGLIGGGTTVASLHTDHWIYAEYASQKRIQPDTWGMGGYVETASPPATVEILVFWLDLS